MANWGIILWLLGLSVITFFTVAWLLDFNNRLRQVQERIGKLFTDAEGEDLTKPLEALMVRLDVHDERMERVHSDLDHLTAHLPQSLQAVGLVRFKAFSDYGGDQSFALALADASGNGLVMSSIFAREGTRVYAKPLEEWTSTYSLSFEEEEAINQAQQQLET
jgi:hypothetical protein